MSSELRCVDNREYECRSYLRFVVFQAEHDHFHGSPQMKSRWMWDFCGSDKHILYMHKYSIASILIHVKTTVQFEPLYCVINRHHAGVICLVTRVVLQ